MTAETIMSSDLITLAPDDTVTLALTKMRDYRVHNIPVVGKDGECVGLFSLRRLTHALLPKAAQHDHHSLLMDLSFLPDNPDALVERLQEIGSSPVMELLEKKRKLRFCKFNTPIPEVLKLLSENPVSLPLIVLSDDNQLRGVISNWDVLTKVALNILSANSLAPINDQANTAQSISTEKPEN